MWKGFLCNRLQCSEWTYMLWRSRTDIDFDLVIRADALRTSCFSFGRGRSRMYLSVRVESVSFHSLAEAGREQLISLFLLICSFPCQTLTKLLCWSVGSISFLQNRGTKSSIINDGDCKLVAQLKEATSATHARRDCWHLLMPYSAMTTTLTFTPIYALQGQALCRL